jgi:hypothetical protein
MIKTDETVHQDTLQTCTTRALDALGALKDATSTFRRLPVPAGTTEREMHEAISRKLKKVHAEIMAVLFVTSTLVDSATPQVPQKH